MLDIEIIVKPSKVFLYTDENYSHIDNKIDLDNGNIFNDIKQFSSYMHFKHIKSLEKYRQKDTKLIEELKDIEKLKAIDADLEGTAYIYCFDLM